MGCKELDTTEQLSLFSEKLRNKQAEMGNKLEGINRRITEAEEQINDLEDRMVEIIATEQNTEKKSEKK